MSLVGFRAQNHPQQRGRDEIDDRTTVAEIFDPLHARFNFTIDVAASAHNARLPRYYTREQDGLRQSWAGESVWCNPPYSGIEPWVAKSWLEHPATRGIVMILPANRTEQAWWQTYVEPFRDRPGSPLTVEFLPGRIRFLARGRSTIGPNERPPFGCCLLIWRAPIGAFLTVQQMLGGAS